MEQSSVNCPLLLLNNETLAYILGNGDYRVTNLTFDEAKSILDMYAEEDIAKCFDDYYLENVIHEYLGIERREFQYRPVGEMELGQDGIAFKLYITASGTQPIILGDRNEQAKKIKNVYIYCQHIVKLK